MEVCGTPWYSYYVTALLRGLSLTLCTPTAVIFGGATNAFK